MCFQELKGVVRGQDVKRIFLWEKGNRMLVRREVDDKSIRCLQTGAYRR
jgi:hypothetical protein